MLHSKSLMADKLQLGLSENTYCSHVKTNMVVAGANAYPTGVCTMKIVPSGTYIVAYGAYT